MDPIFLFTLDNYRGVVGKPCALTSDAWTAGTGHSKNSFHYLGRAADCRFLDPKTKEPLSLAEHVLIAMKAPFNGVGIYTWWPNGAGLHFDNRAENERKIWVSEKAGEYVNLTPEILLRLLQ